MADTKDMIYLAVLSASIPLGHVLKVIPNPRVKQIFGGIVGFVIAILVCGWQVFHSLVTVAVNYLFIRYVSEKYCHILSFIFCFLYIGFTRVAFMFGFGEINGHTNVIQLILTVKLVGLAFDIHDCLTHQRRLKKTDGDGVAVRSLYRDDYDPALLGFQMPTTLPTIPSVLEYLNFSYCFIGLLTGPFYRISTYRHAMWRPNSADLATLWPSLLRLAPLPLYGVITLTFGKYFPHQYISSDAYAALPYIQRILYVIPAFIGYRYRYYAGWSLAETAAVGSGIGAYPAETQPVAGLGPSKPMTGEPSGKLDFSAVYNLDVYRIETAHDMRTAIRHWNMSVQWWMTFYIYKRFPSKQFRFAAVMFASAYWHGVHLGYYLCFMSTVLTSVAESTWWKATEFIRNKGPAYEKVLYFIGWLFCYRYFEHLAIGFMLLYPSVVFKAWQNTYFFGHTLALLMLVVATVMLKLRPRHKKE